MYFNNIEGHFNFEEIYNMVLDEVQESDIIVEIGAFLGKSTCYMAERIKQLELNIKFHTVDTFVGSPNDELLGRIEELGDVYSLFLENMKKAAVLDLIIIHKMQSVDAADLFTDNSLSFVFVDGAHDYESIKIDIEVWYPKIKMGGLIGGHDYGNRIRTGVDRAVSEKFGSDFELIKNSWLHRKKKDR